MTVRESKWLKNLEIAASLVSEELTVPVRRHCDCDSCDSTAAASSNASSKGANETDFSRYANYDSAVKSKSEIIENDKPESLIKYSLMERVFTIILNIFQIMIKIIVVPTLRRDRERTMNYSKISLLMVNL